MIIKLQTDVVSYQKIKGKHSLGVKSAQLALFGVCIKKPSSEYLGNYTQAGKFERLFTSNLSTFSAFARLT